MARRRSDESLSVVGTLEQTGPLGAGNMRRQLGRSDKLIVGRRTEVTLVQAGSDGAAHGGPSLGEALAQSMVLTCTYRLDPTRAQEVANPGNLKARVLGRISYGNDGHGEEIRFDWRFGTTIRVPAGFVRLSAELGPELMAGEQPTSDVVVGAFAAYGQPVHCATLTQRLTVTPSPGILVPVPSRARRFTAWAGAQISTRWMAGTTWVGADPIRMIGNSQGEEWSVIPAGCTAVQLFASPTREVLWIWELDT